MKLFKVFALLLSSSSVLSSSIVWDSSVTGQLLKNGVGVTIKGFALTCTEYLLKGIGVDCIAAYNYQDPAAIITTLDEAEMNAIYANLLPFTADVQPALRVCLNAAYLLDIPTTAWSSARSQYPNLSQQYNTLIDLLVTDATSKGIVIILDLHWNDDVTQQQPMALKGTSSTGDSLTFWTTLATRYASNPLVFYELYNEPHISSYSSWLNGDSTYEGMAPMAAAIRALNVKGMIVVGGQQNYAYDGPSLISFATDAPLAQIMFNFHPYMGPYQAQDPSKSADGFVSLVNSVRATVPGVPIIATELGQYCCASEGSCYQYGGTFNGVSMGYVHAILTYLSANQMSYTVWAWRPSTSSGDCNQPDANDADSLYNAASHTNQGANYVSLWPSFFAGAGAPFTTSPTAPSSTLSPTKAPTNVVAQTTLPPTKAPTNVVALTTLPPTKAPTNVVALTTLSPTTNTKAPTNVVALTTLSPTTNTKAPTNVPSTNTSACSGVYGQCGGLNYSGSTRCCNANNTCVVINAYYFQCLAITSSPGTIITLSPSKQGTSATTTTLSPSNPPSSSVGGTTTLSPSNPPSSSVGGTTTAPFSVANTVFSTTQGRILRNGSPVVARGVVVTCMEYLLRGIGGNCLATYNYQNKAAVITTLNVNEMQNIYNVLLLPVSSDVVPAIRLCLNAAYVLNVVTSQWSANNNQYPNLSQQYNTLIDNIVQDATSRGVAIILDLHWNDDVTAQQPMALLSSANQVTGDSLQFWTTLATRYKNNPYVWYELYNEPYQSSYSLWLSGDTVKYAGMQQMADLVRAQNVMGLILVAGQKDYAYDAASLVQFSKDASTDRVVFVFHPYMGPYQAGDSNKNVPGFTAFADSIIANTNVPIMVTEYGQYCCASNGACFLYNGVNRGIAMGYVEALLVEMANRSISWTVWAYRPGTGGDCNQPDFNDGGKPYNASAHGEQGADYVTLFPKYYAGTASSVFSGGNTAAPTSVNSFNDGSTATVVGLGVGLTFAALVIAGLVVIKRRKAAIKRELQNQPNQSVQAHNPLYSSNV